MLQEAINFQEILINLNASNLNAQVQQTDDLIKSFNIDEEKLFIRTFFSVLPARYTLLNIFAEYLCSIQISQNQEFRELFFNLYKKRFSQPNQEVISVFAANLIQSQYCKTEEILDIILSVFETPSKVPNEVCIQTIFLLVKCAPYLVDAPQDKLDTIIHELDNRKHVIEAGLFQDPNSPLFLDFYDDLVAIRENIWKIPPSVANRDLIEALILDDSAFVRKGLDDGTIDPNQHLDLCVLIVPPMLSFCPPILSFAAFFGAKNCFSLLLDNDASIDDVDDEARPVLHFAAAGGLTDIVDLVKERTDDYRGVLSACVEFFHLELLKHVIRVFHIPQLNYGFEESEDNVFHMAARNNWIAAMEFLHSRRVMCESFDEYHWTPLHIAASYEAAEAAQLLLEYGADPNAKDLDMDTPLHCAAKEGDVAIMSALFNARGVDVNASDRHGATPLHWAACNDQARAVELLLARPNVIPNVEDMAKRTPLALACISGSAKAAAALVADSRVTPNTVDAEGKTPLMSAVEYGEEKIVAVVLSCEKIELEARHKEHGTAVEMAAFSGKAGIVRMLKLAGADVSGLERSAGQLSEDVLTALR